jgi:hypothetical protein
VEAQKQPQPESEPKVPTPPKTEPQVPTKTEAAKPEAPYITKQEFQQIMTQFAKLIDERFKTIEKQNTNVNPPENPTSTPTTPTNILQGLGPLAPLLASILTGGGGEIIPAEMQKQIVANMFSQYLNPPDRFGDFLKGFNTALKTLAILTRRKMPEFTLEEEK